MSDRNHSVDLKSQKSNFNDYMNQLRLQGKTSFENVHVDKHKP